MPRITELKNRRLPANQFANDILSLIHLYQNSLGEKAPKIVHLADLKKVTLESDMLNTKLVKLKLPTVKEAKNRAIVLALLTCNYRKSSNCFVRFFTQKDFEYERSRQTYQSL